MEFPSMEYLLIYIIITAYACWSAIKLGVKLGYLAYTDESKGNSKDQDEEPTKPRYRHKNTGHGYEYPQLPSAGSAKSSATMTAAQSGSQTPAMIFNTMNLFSPLTYNTGEAEKIGAEVVSADGKKKKKKEEVDAAAWAREYPSIVEMGEIKLARITDKYKKVRKENEELKESRDYDVKENDRLNKLVKASAQAKVAIWDENRALREEMKQLQIKVHNTRTVDDFYYLINRKIQRSREEVEQMVQSLSNGTLQDDIVEKMKGVDDVKGGLEVRIGELEAEIVRVREEGEREAERRELAIMNEADRRMLLAYEERHQASLQLHDTFLERAAEKEEIAAIKKKLAKEEKDLREQKRLTNLFNEAVNMKHLKVLEQIEKWTRYKEEWEQNNRFFVRKLWHHTTRGQRQYWQDLLEEEGFDLGGVIGKLIQGCMEKDRVIGRVVDERDEERRRHGETRRRLGRSQMKVYRVRVGGLSQEGSQEVTEEVTGVVEEMSEQVSEPLSEERGGKVSGSFDEEDVGWPSDVDVGEQGEDWGSEGGWEEDEGKQGDEEEAKRVRKATVEEVQEDLITF